MSVELVAADGRHLGVQGYNWDVLHVTVQDAHLFPEDLWGPLRYHSGGLLDRHQVQTLRRFLRSKVLPRIGKNQRMFLNGDVADEDREKESAILRHEREHWKNFSLRRTVLVEILDFLKTASAPLKVC